MQIVNLFPGSVGSNCYLIEDSGQALIVDPSASASAILRRLREDGCTPVGILLTHGHFDHVMSVDTLRGAEPDLKVYIHEADAPMLTDGEKNAFALWLFCSQYLSTISLAYGEYSAILLHSHQ